MVNPVRVMGVEVSTPVEVAAGLPEEQALTDSARPPSNPAPLATQDTHCAERHKFGRREHAIDLPIGGQASPVQIVVVDEVGRVRAVGGAASEDDGNLGLAQLTDDVL